MSDPCDLMVMQTAQQIPEARRAEYMMAYQSQKKARGTALLLSLFLGTFGADRFYLGQTGLGVAKLLTGGGCLLWTILDWFMIMGSADTHNRGVLHRLAMLYPPSNR